MERNSLGLEATTIFAGYKTSEVYLEKRKENICI